MIYTLDQGQLPAPGRTLLHDLIYFVYSIKETKTPSKFISCRVFKHVNYKSCLADIVSKPWNRISNIDNV